MLEIAGVRVWWVAANSSGIDSAGCHAVRMKVWVIELKVIGDVSVIEEKSIFKF